MEPATVAKLPGFKRRMEWFIENRKDLAANVAVHERSGEGQRRLLSIVNGEQLRRVLSILLDENEFLSPYGIRALSRFHKDHPYVMRVDGTEYRVDYEPAESATGLFGGNSNWRGSGMVPGELPDHRIAAKIQPLLRVTISRWSFRPVRATS